MPKSYSTGRGHGRWNDAGGACWRLLWLSGGAGGGGVFGGGVGAGRSGAGGKLGGGAEARYLAIGALDRAVNFMF